MKKYIYYIIVLLAISCSGGGKESSQIPAFSLQSHTGHVVTDKSLQGNVYVMDFFFTSCPGICKDLTRKMRELQETFKDEAEFKLVSVSVDPEKDSIPVLNQYAIDNGAEPGKWVFLTGNMEKIEKLMVQGLKLGYDAGDGKPENVT